ncbi:MAG TPA: diguanylate cyclase, partial [Rubrobacteraceae bacterium]|nr:diguanylate cyclase [Rubrobacteraceae bacterium]
RGEGRLVRPAGESVFVKVAVSPVREGEDRGVAVIEDITRQRRAEEAFAESEGRFRQIFENSVDALLIHDEEGRIVDCNVEAYRSLGYTREELLTLSIRDIAEDVISDEEREAMTGETPWQRAMSGRSGAPVGTHENRHRRKDGTTFPVEVALASMDYGGRRMILAVVRDITERKAREELLSHQAFHDSLTGLPNRALFTDRLEHALARRERAEFGIAILFLDLDNFKDVNDTFGHETGDRLLVEIGGRLASCIRSSDTVARLAGDEFTVLLEDVAEIREAVRVIERIETVFRDPVRIDARDLTVTASIGVVLETGSGRSLQELLNDADTAMYRAKNAGKARYEIYGFDEPESD